MKTDKMNFNYIFKSMVKICRMTKILNNTLYFNRAPRYLRMGSVLRRSEGNSYQHENTTKL